MDVGGFAKFSVICEISVRNCANICDICEILQTFAKHSYSPGPVLTGPVLTRNLAHFAKFG